MTPEVVSGLVAAVAALVISLINVAVDKIRHKHINEIIRENPNALYITCPYCGKKIMLMDVVIYEEKTKNGNKK